MVEKTSPLNLRWGSHMARTPEGKFQDLLRDELENNFEGCLILKNDPNLLQGVPDLLVLFRNRWALLEVKKSANERKQPNQRFYVDWANQNSFGAFVFPENFESVMIDLQNFFYN